MKGVSVEKNRDVRSSVAWKEGSWKERDVVFKFWGPLYDEQQDDKV